MLSSAMRKWLKAVRLVRPKLFEIFAENAKNKLRNLHRNSKKTIDRSVKWPVERLSGYIIPVLFCEVTPFTGVYFVQVSVGVYTCNKQKIAYGLCNFKTLKTSLVLIYHEMPSRSYDFLY